MKPAVPLYRFTLGAGQSIGPAALRSMWIRACRSVDVSVGRDASAHSHGRPVYSLYASSRQIDLPDVERRLRQLLEEAKLTANLMRLHLA